MKDEKDQLIRQLQARVAAAEKKKLPPKRKRAQSGDARTNSTSQSKLKFDTLVTNLSNVVCWRTLLLLCCVSTVLSIDSCTKATHHIQPPNQSFNYSIPPYQNGSSPLLPMKYQTRMSEKLMTFTLDLIDSYPPNRTDYVLRSFGNALAFLRLYKNTKTQTYLDKAKDYIDAALPNANAEDYNQVGYGSWPGIFTISTIIYDLSGKAGSTTTDHWTSKIQNAFDHVENTADNTFLEGLAGLLHTATILESYYGKPVITRDSVVRVGNLIYQNGVAHSLANGTTPYLQWKLSPQGTGFLGMASGWGGPLFALMQISELMADQNIAARVRATMDFFLTMVGPDGDFFSVIPNRIQWCHGSPGVVPLFNLAHQVFGDEKYQTAAQQTALFSVKRGIIEKGLQLVHGVTGNTYLVLSMYSQTKDPQWLYYAYQMQMVTLDNPLLVDLNGQAVTYDCVIGSALVSTYSAIMIWSDLLTNMNTPEQSHAPFFGMQW